LSVISEWFYQESILFRIKASGFPIKDLGNDGGGVIPECFYQESILFRINASGFPIKDFRNDRKGTSFLNVSIRNLYYLE